MKEGESELAYTRSSDGEEKCIRNCSSVSLVLR
jgi:hypothetical protein